MTEEEPLRSTVKFTDAPPTRTKRYDWDGIAGKLRRKPGEWALIYEGDRATYATAIRNDDIKALRKGAGFEMRTAKNTRDEPRTCDLYLRYVPEKDTTIEKKGG